ncbi:THO complex subunit 4B [Yarrowia sp. C11]|nr:THO complex subunit 4B [Yarrowia sp. C11]
MDQALDEIIAQPSRRDERPPRPERSRRSDRGDRSDRRGGRDYDDRRYRSRELRGDRGDRGRFVEKRYRDARPNTVLLIKNLHYDLTENDLYDLFNKVGRVDDVEIHYDRAGRSLGDATVVFSQPEDAQDAIAKFDGKRAAGLKIEVKIDHRRDPGHDLSERFGPRDRSLSPGRDRPYGGYREDRPPRRGRGGRGRGRREGPAPSGRIVKEKKTVEELDAELDSYMQD